MNYFDLHCDTLFRMADEDVDFDDSRLAINRSYIDCFDRYYQSFAIWTPDKICDKYDFLTKILNCFETKIKPLKSDTFKPLVSVEGADFISGNLDILYYLKEQNVFSLSLTWNNENLLAGGVNSECDLKPLGADVIKVLNETGIYCDLSHLNKKSFFSALKIADNVVATHTYIYELNQHRRNLTLEQMKLIKEKNGLIGLCFYPEFLGGSNIYQSIFDALDFCLSNDFAENIAFGSDFDGATIPMTLGSVPDLYNYLRDRGIDKKTLDLFFFTNAFNQFKSFDK